MEKKVLFNFLEFPAISGKEEAFLHIIKDRANYLGLDYQYDNLGSLTIIKKTQAKDAKKLMIDAHVDQVGLEVIGIKANGLLEIEEKGYISSKALLFQRVRIWTDDLLSYFSGVIVSQKIDLTKVTADLKDPSIEEFLVDLGALSKNEVEELGIKIGTSITFDTVPYINNKSLISQAIDNRIGVYILYYLLEFITKNTFDYDIYCTFSVQEEVGLRGSRTSTAKYDPDLAIVIDISPTNDYNEDNSIRGQLGGGTILRYKDAVTIYPKVVINYLNDIFKKNQIKFQDYFSSGGTNAGIIHIVGTGRVVIPIGIVARNLHTSSSIINLDDLEETIKLLECVLKDLTNEKIKSFKQLGV